MSEPNVLAPQVLAPQILAPQIVEPHASPSELKSLASASEALPAAPVLVPVPADKPRLELVWGADKVAISTAGSFVYSKIHQATPLPDSLLAAMRAPDGDDAAGAFSAPRHASMDFDAGRLHVLSSRPGLCSAIASIAEANDLPVPFFANLIWQESTFRSQTISSAGALGIAQFMPETAAKHGLTNPFDPMHALFVSGKHLRKLNEQFGNLGLAAAAYNAGPQRVRSWMAERRTLPSETRAYVMQITGRPAHQWLSSEIASDPEAKLMPAKAPCPEVVVALEVQAEVVRMAKLMAEFAKAAATPSALEKSVQDKPVWEKPAQKSVQEKPAQDKPVVAKPVQQKPAPVIARAQKVPENRTDTASRHYQRDRLGRYHEVPLPRAAHRRGEVSVVR